MKKIITASVLVASFLFFSCTKTKEIYFYEDKWETNLPKDLYFKKGFQSHYEDSVSFRIKKSINPFLKYLTYNVEFKLEKSKKENAFFSINHGDYTNEDKEFDLVIYLDINKSDKSDFPQKLFFTAHYVNDENVLYVIKHEFTAHLKD